MSFLIRFINKSPMPKQWRLEWQRSLLTNAYTDDINKAKKNKDKGKVQSLQHDFRFEMDLHEEDEDEFHTKTLLRQARRLRVPIPHRINEGGKESECWYQGNYTGGWYLTNKGTSELRKEIRNEIKARSESRTVWVIWVSGLTGIIGAISGLVAVISKIN